MTAAHPVPPLPTTEPPGETTVLAPTQSPVVVVEATLPRPVRGDRKVGAAVTATVTATETELLAQARCSVRPAPRREPAYDDEPAERHLRLVRASSAPELPFPVAPRTADPHPRRLTLVTAPAPPPTPTERAARGPAAAGRPGPTGTPAVPMSPRPPVDHPDPARFGRQFAQGAIEVLSGRRPMVQLARHVSPAVQRGLARAGGEHPLSGAGTPSLHSLHLSAPADGVCEMSAIVVVGARYRALAARLEWQVDHWRCTALQLG